jgi:MFS family permease
MTILGAWIGSAVSNNFVGRYGLRPTTLANNVLYIAGGIVTSFPSFPLLLTGRFVSGLAVGVTSATVPVLLAEISPDALRGTITSFHQLLITIGITASALIAYGLVKYVDHGWRYVQGFVVVPAALQLLFAAFVSESPRWLCR